jgi:hypothetical protein
MELFSFVIVKLRLIPFFVTPDLYLNHKDGIVSSDKWRNEKFEWGGWHNASITSIHEGACFTTYYKSNNLGARDDEFYERKDKKRIVLIGDSFAEGFGVESSKTVASLLERTTEYEVYNFGSTPDIGPVQYNILYKRLAKKYEHDILIIFFLPINDFNDNDYHHWQLLKRNIAAENFERFRPYWKKIGENTYDYFIPEQAIKTNDQYSEIMPFRTFFMHNFWFYNVYQALEFYYKIYKLSYLSGVPIGAILDSSNGYSGYFDATEEQQKAAVWFIDDLISSSDAKKIFLVSIPARSDYKQLKAGRSVDEMFWYKSFNSAAYRLNKDVTFVDLSKIEQKNSNDLFLPCDAHWGNAGNAMAAAELSRLIKGDMSLR